MSIQLPRSAPDGTTKIVFKHEDESAGPAWFRLADGSMKNVHDTGRLDFNKKPTPTWFTLAQMRRYAKALRLPLEEV